MAGKKEEIQKVSKKTKYINTLWLAAAVMSFFLLIGTAFGHMEEISLKQLAHSLEADYIDDGNNRYAEYYDENHELHRYNLNSHSPIHSGDKITLYYAANIDEAVPENTVLSWLAYYIIYGSVFALSMWKVRKAASQALD